MNAQVSPTRTCAACRQRKPANELVRFVDGFGQLCVDLSRRMPGRGVHLCPKPSCLRRAVKRSVFGRSLRGASVPKSSSGDPYVGLVELLAGALATDQQALLDHGERVARCGHPTSQVAVSTNQVSTGSTAGATAPVVSSGRVARRHLGRLSWLSASHREFTLESGSGMNRRPDLPTPGASSESQ